MKLFHYHWWTNKVEEMEVFYSKLGFEVTLRTGYFKGDWHTYNPPLTWDDFREKEIMFRIIEMRKGKSNLTFGNGNRDRFDHIGFLVNEEEYQCIIKNAKTLGWKVNEGERRTFISTPWRFRVELQIRRDVVTESDDTSIQSMHIRMPFEMHPSQFGELMGLEMKKIDPNTVKVAESNWTIVFTPHQQTELKSIVFQSESLFDKMDPVHTRLTTVSH